MTEYEQRIAIAEWMGWTDILSPEVAQEFDVTGTPPNWGDTGVRYHRVPDAPNDLNAMHEVEQKLMREDWETYREVYIRREMDVYQFNGVSATASERSKAFCRTIWPERM